MQHFIFTKKIKTKGNVMIITTFLFVAITLSISLGLVMPVIGAYGAAKTAIKTKASYALAESGIEDTYYRLSNSKNVVTTSTLVLGSATATTTLTDISATQKQIKSIGVFSQLNRIASVIVAKAATASFPYGAIVGTGGLSMENGQTITGSVYSNGPIFLTADNSVNITGAATSVVSIAAQNSSRPINIGTGGVFTAFAPTVNNVNATGTIYCTTGSGNNKACNTTLGTPTVQPMPFADATIADFKTQASSTVVNGNVNYSANATISARKIIGNLQVSGGAVLKITGPLYVTGNLIISNGTINVDASYGGGSVPVVVDGYINVTSGGTFNGTGVAGSYIVLISTSDCPTSGLCGGNPAIFVQGGSNCPVGGTKCTVALVAQNGTVRIDSNTITQQATAKKLELKGSIGLNYSTNLATITFASGSGWGVTSWQETAN